MHQQFIENHGHRLVVLQVEFESGQTQCKIELVAGAFAHTRHKDLVGIASPQACDHRLIAVAEAAADPRRWESLTGWLRRGLAQPALASQQFIGPLAEFLGAESEHAVEVGIIDGSQQPLNLGFKDWGAVLVKQGVLVSFSAWEGMRATEGVLQVALHQELLVVVLEVVDRLTGNPKEQGA